MQEEEIIINIIKSALQVDKVTIDSSTDNLEEWDSLGHLSILVALDREFEGNLAGISDMATADSVKKIILILDNNNFI
jgi:acyl carrier protein